MRSKCKMRWWWDIKRPPMFHHSSHAHSLSSLFTCAILYLSFSHPELSSPFQPAIAFSHSFHPEHFPFFHLFSISLPIPPTSLRPPSLSLSVFWTFLLVLSVSLHPPHPNLPHPPLSPCDEWVCLLGAVHIYWAGERTLSVSLTLHISIHSLKRQREPEVTVGWEEAGGRGQEIYSTSHCCSSWLGREHISPDQHSFSMLPLEVV